MHKNDIILHITSHVPMMIDIGSHAASVIILMLEDANENLSVVLTKRADHLLTYSGDYCFPGGVFENSDINLKSTAQRELTEELGISHDEYKIIGQLDDFHDRYGNTVRPFVALIDKDKFEKSFRLAPSEVTALYYFPINHLLMIKPDFELEKITRRAPTYIYNYHNIIVWGLTASIMVHFANIIYNTNKTVIKYVSRHNE